MDAPVDKRDETIAMSRLIASLLVAVALFAAPLATANGSAAMAQTSACPSVETSTGCPDSDDTKMPCTHGSCVSVCASFCLLSAAIGPQFQDPAAKLFGGPPRQLVGIVPEAENRPPRPNSEM